MKVFSLAKLKSVAPAENAVVFKLKLVALLRSTRHHLPSPLEEVINGAMGIWAVSRYSSGAPCLRGSAPPSARALTHREAARIDNRNKHRPLFIKTVITQHAHAGHPIIPQQEASVQSCSLQASQPSQSYRLSRNSFNSSKPSYIPLSVYLHKKAPKTGKAPALPNHMWQTSTLLIFSLRQPQTTLPMGGGSTVSASL